MKPTTCLTCLLGFLTTHVLAQDSSSSSSIAIPGPMEQSVTEISSTAASSTMSSSDMMSSSMTGSSDSSMMTTTTNTVSFLSATSTYSNKATEGVGGAQTRTGVSEPQATEAAGWIQGVGVEQVVMMGMGVGAALAV